MKEHSIRPGFVVIEHEHLGPVEERPKRGMLKVISIDNLDRETVADSLIIRDIPDTDDMRKVLQDMCDHINKLTCHDHGGRYYKIVDDAYRLSKGMEDLV